MKLAFLDAATLGDDLDLSPFRALGELVIYGNTAPHEVAARVADCHVVVVNKIKLNQSNLENTETLRLICVAATGFDGIDLSYCRSRGIGVCNVVGYSTQSVAQVTLALTLSLVNHLTEYRRFVDSGDYLRAGLANRLEPVYHEMSSMTWGVVGLGNIGRRVADMARALGAHVIATRHRDLPDETYETVTVDELCRRADIISVHTPLNEGTRGLIDGRRLSMMKPGTVLVNVARGAVLDEGAVAKAVLDGHLGGFAADVYSIEPFGEDHPYRALMGRENVIFTPHMAWGAYEARERCMAEIRENIRVFFEGGIRNRVDLTHG